MHFFFCKSGWSNDHHGLHVELLVWVHPTFCVLQGLLFFSFNFFILPFADSLKLGYFRLITMFASTFMLLFFFENHLCCYLKGKKGIEKVHKDYHF